jgi:hypothetical protein
MTGLLIGHCHLKGHLFKLELVNSPECNRCKQASKTASHILCDCEALATFKIQALGSSFDATRWLWRHIYRQDTVLCSRCRAARCIRAAQRIKCGWSAWVTNVPTLHVSYFILFYSILWVISTHCCQWHGSANYKLYLSVCFVFLQCKLKILPFCVFCILWSLHILWSN